jgi:hypothetical protein
MRRRALPLSRWPVPFALLAFVAPLAPVVPATAVALAALGSAWPVAAHAQAAGKRPQQKPITREWTCDNGRVVLVNYHPRRIREPAWLTYMGNRIEIARARVDRGIAAASADNKVRWVETGNEANLEYDGLLDQPLRCESKRDPMKPDGKPASTKSK